MRQSRLPISHCRRTFLQRGSYGIGAVALGSLLNRNSVAGDDARS